MDKLSLGDWFLATFLITVATISAGLLVWAWGLGLVYFLGMLAFAWFVINVIAGTIEAVRILRQGKSGTSKLQ